MRCRFPQELRGQPKREPPIALLVRCAAICLCVLPSAGCTNEQDRILREGDLYVSQNFPLGMSYADAKKHAAEMKVAHYLSECMGPDLLPIDCGETATLTLAYIPTRTRDKSDSRYVLASLVFNRDRVLTERHVTVETSKPNVRSERGAEVVAKAQAGDAVAQWELATYYWYGIEGFEKNTTRAVELWTDSCSKGVRAACSNAGLPAR